MKKKSIVGAVAALAIILGGCAAARQLVLPEPDKLLLRKEFVCTRGSMVPVLYKAYYDQDGDPAYAEIIVYGAIDKDGKDGAPLLWMVFKPGTSDLLRIVLTLPGQPARDLASIEELAALFPSPCDLIPAQPAVKNIEEGRA